MSEASSAPGLEPGERVLWSGSPDPAKFFGPPDFYLVPFGLLWLALGLYWGARVLFDVPQGPLWSALVAGVITLFGVDVLIARFFVKAAVKRRTRYWLTDQRALVQGPFGIREELLDRADLSLTVTRNGRHASLGFLGRRAQWLGLVWAGRNSDALYRNSGMDYFVQSKVPAFHDVADVAGLSAAVTLLERR